MFPNTAETLVAMLQLQKANLPEYKTAVGATAADIAEVGEDVANLEYLLQYAALVDAYKRAVTKIKEAIYSGDPTAPVPTFPPLAAPAPPFDLQAGSESRARDRNRRFKAAQGYTAEIGVALGMESDAPKPSPGSLIAALRVSDAGNYQYTVEFKKQGMDAMLIQHRVKGTEIWQDAKTALASPVTISVTPSGGAAIQLEVRGRLLKGNEQIGDWSPIYPLTISS